MDRQRIEQSLPYGSNLEPLCYEDREDVNGLQGHWHGFIEFCGQQQLFFFVR